MSELPSALEDTGPYKDQASQPLQKKNTPLAYKEHSDVGHTHLSSGEESSSATSDPPATCRPLPTSTEARPISCGRHSPRAASDAQSVQGTTDWSFASKFKINDYRKRINALTRRLEQKVSKWNQTTKIALRFREWQTLRVQQEKAEELEESYLQLKTKNDQGPPPSKSYLTRGSQPEQELITAYTTMQNYRSDIVGVFSGDSGALKNPSAGETSSQAMCRESLGQYGVVAPLPVKGDITFDNSACSAMSAYKLGKWKKQSLEKTRRLERTLWKWNEESKDVRTEISTVPTGGALYKLEKRLGQAQRLETRCIRLNKELSRGPSLAMHDGLGSRPLRRLATARKVMNRELSALKNLSHKAQSCLMVLESNQAQSGIVATSQMDARSSDYNVS